MIPPRSKDQNWPSGICLPDRRSAGVRELYNPTAPACRAADRHEERTKANPTLAPVGRGQSQGINELLVRPGGPLPSDRRHSVLSTGTLRVGRVALHDHGQYECHAISAIGVRTLPVQLSVTPRGELGTRGWQSCDTDLVSWLITIRAGRELPPSLWDGILLFPGKGHPAVRAPSAGGKC